MKQNLRTFLLLSASLGFFLIYCTMWIDWLQDIQTGTYGRHYIEAFFETVALGGYTYLGIRFAFSRLHLF
ncbi:hypothetical protein [Fibrella forsythiae]|uniref:Uncharacterized protein n=1 Tax=Fibrella forsythiae TaxID=2817061 RepID=A0ABS3JMF8_9BACT|nr:hypothetical protein [Fibrella forsythiae]MBO0950087.1 hypothetical protein [Fibrella forsythiae]